jgi:hypothetical protein
MNKIVLPNTDGKIWEIEHKVVDIISILSKHGNCIVDLNNEGPCADSLQLYNLLDYICDRFSINKSCIEIVTCNQIESHSEYKITIRPPLYVNETQEFYRYNHNSFFNKSFENIKPIGMFIGRSNFLRLQLASDIYYRYQNQVEMTFHYDRALDFHRPHCGIEDLINQGCGKNQILDSLVFLHQCPKKFPEEKISYPILTPSHLDICKYYHGFFCEIVCETYFSGNSFYPTEKIWRPLLMKTPFIVQGPKYFLDNLKKLGFKTFDQWWDEGHQHDSYDYQPNAIMRVVENILSLSNEELQQMYTEMLPVLQHNHDRFMDLQNAEFPKVFGYT